MSTNLVPPGRLGGDPAAQAGLDVPVVVVQMDWRDWHRAFVPLAAVENVHWRHASGAPRPLLHGYVWCSRVLAGALQHNCAAGDSPHRLLVCILKRHTVPSLYEAMCRRAGEC